VQSPNESKESILIMPKLKDIVKSFIETPFGDIERNEQGDLELVYVTDDFSDFAPSIAIDNEIDVWLIDHDWKILERGIYFNDPIVETLNYIYYNEKTNDYEEVEVPVGYSSSMDVGSFMLRYKLEKA
jgi:CRISPR/Cas system-associated protein Csx1